MTAISVLYRYKEYMTSVMLYRSKENFLHARHWSAQNFHHVTLWIEVGACPGVIKPVFLKVH